MACPTRIISATRVGNLLLGEAEIATAPPGQTLSVPGKVLTKKNGVIHPTPLWWIDAPFSFSQYDAIDSSDGLLKRFLKVDFSIPYDGSTGEPQEPDPGAIYQGYFLVEDEADNQVQVDFCLGIPTSADETNTFILGLDSANRVVAGVISLDTDGNYSVTFSQLGTFTANHTSDINQPLWYDSNSGKVVLLDTDPGDASTARIRVFDYDDPDGTITTIVDNTDSWADTGACVFTVGSDIYFVNSGNIRKVGLDGTGKALVGSGPSSPNLAYPGDTGEFIANPSNFLRAYLLSDGTQQHSTGLNSGGTVDEGLGAYIPSEQYVFWGRVNTGSINETEKRDISDLSFIEYFRDPSYDIDFPVGEFPQEDQVLVISDSGSAVRLLRRIEKDQSEGFTITVDMDAKWQADSGEASTLRFFTFNAFSL